MAKYIYLYIIVVTGILLMCGSSLADSAKSQESLVSTLPAATAEAYEEMLCSLSPDFDSGQEHHSPHIEYTGQTSSARIGLPISFRFISLCKTIKCNATHAAAKIARFLKIALPEDYLFHIYSVPSLTPCCNQSHIYAIRHILI